MPVSVDATKMQIDDSINAVDQSIFVLFAFRLHWDRPVLRRTIVMGWKLQKPSCSMAWKLLGINVLHCMAISDLWIHWNLRWLFQLIYTPCGLRHLFVSYDYYVCFQSLSFVYVHSLFREMCSCSAHNVHIMLICAFADVFGPYSLLFFVCFTFADGQQGSVFHPRSLQITLKRPA